jgi:hypothetical protein
MTYTVAVVDAGSNCQLMRIQQMHLTVATNCRSEACIRTNCCKCYWCSSNNSCSRCRSVFSCLLAVEVSATLTTLSEGTCTVMVRLLVPVPDTSVVTVKVQKLYCSTCRCHYDCAQVMAATTARAIFLNEFIFLLLLFILLILFLVYPNSLLHLLFD